MNESGYNKDKTLSIKTFIIVLFLWLVLMSLSFFKESFLGPYWAKTPNVPFLIKYLPTLFVSVVFVVLGGILTVKGEDKNNKKNIVTVLIIALLIVAVTCRVWEKAVCQPVEFGYLLPKWYQEIVHTIYLNDLYFILSIAIGYFGRNLYCSNQKLMKSLVKLAAVFVIWYLVQDFLHPNTVKTSISNENYTGFPQKDNALYSYFINMFLYFFTGFFLNIEFFFSRFRNGLNIKSIKISLTILILILAHGMFLFGNRYGIEMFNILMNRSVPFANRVIMIYLGYLVSFLFKSYRKE